MSAITAIAAGFCLVLPFSLAFAGRTATGVLSRVRLTVRLSLPLCLGIPYLLVSIERGVFQMHWLLVYALLPTLIAVVLWRAHERDPEQIGHWLDFAVLLILGLIVEFRRFDAAWPAHLSAFNRIILLDAGLYGFVVIRRLSNVGFDLRPQLCDWKNGLRELAFYAPIAVPLGLAIGFLHTTQNGQGSSESASPWFRFSFWWRFLRRHISAGGGRTCWSGGLGQTQHCWLHQRSLGCRTSTRAPPRSTGVMCCWQRSQGSSTAGRGGPIIASLHQRLLTPVWMRYGYCGCVEPSARVSSVRRFFSPRSSHIPRPDSVNNLRSGTHRGSVLV